jgi:hypothetical protein
LLVRVVQAPGELDGHVQDGFGGGQPPGLDRVLQAAAVYVLGKDAGTPSTRRT